MEEGIVKLVPGKDKFGFLECGGKDVYFERRYLPDAKEGDKVEFEEAENARGQKYARKMKILMRADGTPYAPGLKTGASEISVTVEFGEPRLTQVGKGRRSVHARLPVWIQMKSTSGQPIVGKEVKLDYNGRPAIQLATSVLTLGDGKAFIPVILPQGSTSCHFVADVDGKSYGFYWDKDKIDGERKAAEEAANAQAQAELAKKSARTREAPKVRRLHLARGVYTFLIQTAPNTEVTLDSIVPIQTRQLPCDGSAPWTHNYEYKTDDGGNLQIQVRVEEDGARGDLFACNGHLRSDPQYVVHPNRPKKKTRRHHV